MAQLLYSFGSFSSQASPGYLKERAGTIRTAQPQGRSEQKTNCPTAYKTKSSAADMQLI
jgi:hypothetical protein